MSQNEKRKLPSNAIHIAIRRYRSFRTPRLQLLMFILATYGNPEGKNIWPGQVLLAADMTCSVRTVQRLLSELESDGFIVTTNRKGGRGNVTHYEISLVKLGIELENHDFVQQNTVTLPVTPTVSPTNGHHEPAPESPAHRLAKLRQRLELRQRKMEQHPQMKLYRELYEDTLREMHDLEKEKQNV